LRLLRALLREGVPITNWQDILKAVREVGLKSNEIDHAVSFVRLRIKNDLPGNKPGVDQIDVPREIESGILQRLITVDDRKFLAIPPEEKQDLLARVRELVREDTPSIALSTEREDSRAPLRRVTELEFPHIAVQWRAETLAEELRHNRLGKIAVIAEWSRSGKQSVDDELVEPDIAAPEAGAASEAKSGPAVPRIAAPEPAAQSAKAVLG
jgi:flagellar biosynthesis component FlhA